MTTDTLTPEQIRAMRAALQAAESHVREHHEQDAATGAGEGARIDGEPEDANPHEDDSPLWACWDAGWHAQDVVERLEQAEAIEAAIIAAAESARWEDHDEPEDDPQDGTR